MVGGLQGEEWKFMQKYLKKRSKRVGAQISQFARRFCTLHGDLRKSRKLISQLGIHFLMLSSKFTSCKITFASWALISHVGVPNSQDANLSFNWMQLSCEGHIFLISAPIRTPLKRWILDFLDIACRKWTSGSAPKVRKKIVAAVLCFLHSVFLFSVVLSLHTLNDFGKGLWSSKAWFFMNLSFQKLFHELYTTLPHSWIALV